LKPPTYGPFKGPPKGPLKPPTKGPFKGPPKGPFKPPTNGPLKPPPKGPFISGATDGPGKGPFKPTGKGPKEFPFSKFPGPKGPTFGRTYGLKTLGRSGDYESFKFKIYLLKY